MKKSLFLTEENHNNSIIEKEEEYMEYIRNHINNVIKVFEDMVENINKFDNKGYDDIVEAIKEAEYEGFVYRHDDSKYSDEEFNAYRRYWHSINDQEKEDSKEDFENAWKHHYTVNPHHPEYWLKNNVPQPMELKYIVEMACDWIAMCMVKGGTAIQYYLDNKEEKQKVIHQDSIEILEKILYTYYDIEKE